MKKLFAFAVLCASLVPLHAQPPEPAQPLPQWKVREGNPILIEKSVYPSDFPPARDLPDWALGGAAAISPDGTILVIGGSFRELDELPTNVDPSILPVQGVILLRDAHTGDYIGELRGHKAVVTDIAFSPDGKRLASRGDDSSLFLWDTETGALLHRLNKGHKALITAGEPIPDLKSRSLILMNRARLNLGAWSPDSKTLAAYEETFNPTDRPGQFTPSKVTLKLFDGDSGQLLRTLPVDSGINKVAWTLDGKNLLIQVTYKRGGKAETGIAVLDGQSGEVLRRLAQYTDYQQSMDAFSPDGRYALLYRSEPAPGDPPNSGQGGGFSRSSPAPEDIPRTETALLWDVENDRAVWTQTVPRSEQHVPQPEGASFIRRRRYAGFSQDGKILVTANVKGEVILRDVATGEVQRILSSNCRLHVTGLAISPDARRIAMLEHIATIHLWNLDLPIPTPDE